MSQIVLDAETFSYRLGAKCVNSFLGSKGANTFCRVTFFILRFFESLSSCAAVVLQCASIQIGRCACANRILFPN